MNSSISPVALYPKARGTLRLASPDPLAAPLIDPKLLSEPGETDCLIRALRIARKVFASEAFAKYKGVEVAPGANAQSDEELDRYIRATSYTVHSCCSHLKATDRPLLQSCIQP